MRLAGYSGKTLIIGGHIRPPYPKNMNHLPELSNSPYNFYALRHGQSRANVARVQGHERIGMIVSQPENGVNGFGLTDQGHLQVVESITDAKEAGIIEGKDTFIITSDFKRAVETAEVAKEVLGVRCYVRTALLRERNFGTLERDSAEYYARIWLKDEHNPDHHEYQVESVNQVLDRTTTLIARILKARAIQRKNILLVSHGDTLQILETAFRKMNPGKHRTLEPLQTAELRPLHLIA